MVNSLKEYNEIDKHILINKKIGLIVVTLALIILPICSVYYRISSIWFNESNESSGNLARVSLFYTGRNFMFCSNVHDVDSSSSSSRKEPSSLTSSSSDGGGGEGGESNEVVRHSSSVLNPDKDNTSSESQSSLNLAREMTKQGRLERALKIYLHALAINPHHSDLLNSYGEFLELHKNDIVNAEHHYCKALASNPSHNQALQNHKRTLPLVEELDRMRFTQVDTKLKTLLRVPDNHPGLRRVTSEQYFRHIYHTTAMEGNTFTLSQTRSFVENRIVISGKSIMEHNEILGMEAALHYLNSSLVKRLGTITVEDILQIHKRVLGFVDPIGSGIFRNTQVFVGNFMPPAPHEISDLMRDFIDWLNSDDTVEALHPIEMAALAHYKLVYIHPFYDGNGRTSRLLMNLILMMAGYPPIIIPVERKQDYYQYLETANNGDVRPFIRFISNCAERTLDEYLLSSVAMSNTNRSLNELALNKGAGGGGVGGDDDDDDGLTIVT